MIFPIRLLIFLAFCAGIVWLQIFLSRRQNKWLGLILPFLSFCTSLLAVFNLAAQPLSDTPSLLFTAGSVFLLSNIPTVLFLAIYAACREKYRNQKALDKMQAQDLE